ncbi:hypothetical protein [Methylobacterium sp. J-092]|nr:hypothetical protein [Methylobacterium sp. J-092]MCJ2009390.1 hypothetical protein [Methylobacterium sp. J-092]
MKAILELVEHAFEPRPPSLNLLLDFVHRRIHFQTHRMLCCRWQKRLLE